MSEPSTVSGPEGRTAAERYRDVTAGIADAVAAQRRTDEEEATALARRLALLDARMLKVGERTALTRFAVRLHWETALEALLSEPWIVLRPFPRPDRTAGPDELDRADREMAEAHTRLMSLVTRPRWGFRR